MYNYVHYRKFAAATMTDSCWLKITRMPLGQFTRTPMESYEQIAVSNCWMGMELTPVAE